MVVIKTVIMLSSHANTLRALRYKVFKLVYFGCVSFIINKQSLT